MAWSMDCTKEVAVDLKQVWKFWSNVENWKYDTGIRDIKIDGPFQTNAVGVTYARDGHPWKWKLLKVVPESFASIAMPLNGANLIFNWYFKSHKAGKCTITQRLLLHGDNTEELEPIADSLFSKNLEPGMNKLVDQIEQYAKNGRAVGLI